MSSRNCKEITVQSWKEFQRIVVDPPDTTWAFRGQREAHAPLFTSLSRYLFNFGVSEKAWRPQEERILRIFKRKAHNYVQPIPEANDHFQWLALMEHHGAPTRLLDLTWSPYVAAFFALERAQSDAVVWAINAPKLIRDQNRHPRRNPRTPENFLTHYLNGTKPYVWIGEPDVMNRRLIAQSGTFLMPSVLHEPIEHILGAHEKSNVIVKFLIPHGLRQEGLRELYKMNITPATLFPDLDGLARSMGYELEHHWEFDPHTMRKY